MNKKYLGLISVVVLALGAKWAYSITNDNEAFQFNNNMGAVAHRNQLGTKIQQSDDVSSVSTIQVTNGTHLKRSARWTWAPYLNNGGSTTVDGGIHPLTGPAIPAKALITRSWMEVITKPASTSGTGKLEFYCETVGDILNPFTLDASSAGSLIPGYSDGGVYYMKKISSQCYPKVRVTTNAYQQGRIVLFVEYVVSE